MLSLLWSPPGLVEKRTPAAGLLIEHRELFISRRAITAHVGYAVSQRQALTGARGKRTNRPELVAEHGYDTKFAMHLVRLLLQSLALVEHGGYQLPIPEEDLVLLRAIRAGHLTLRDVLERADYLQECLHDEEEHSRLPERPDPDRVNELLIDVRRTALAA